MRDGAGEVVRFVGVQVDVSAYREQQRPRARADRAARRPPSGAARSWPRPSPLLDASLDLRSTLDSLTRLSVPFLGDVCIVDEIRHDEVRRLAAPRGDPAIERLRARAAEPLPGRPERPDRARRGDGRSEIVTGTDAARSATRTLRPIAAMIVPLKARGTHRSARCVFASLDPSARYGTRTSLLAEDLARRAALALDNARLYEDLGARRAGAAGRALLPQRLPDARRAWTSPRATGRRATGA